MSADSSSPYSATVSLAVDKVQSLESTSPPRRSTSPWGAPVPSREEIARSLSMPILQSDAAREARASAAGDARAGASAPPLPAQGPVIAVSSPRAKVTGVAASTRGRAGAARAAAGPAARPSTAAARRPPSAAAAAPPRARPATAASSSASRTGARGGRVAGAGSGSGEAAADESESYTAKQLRVLEAEMAHLRSTIDVLLESRGVPAGDAAVPPAFSRDSPPRGTSGLHSAAGTLSTLPAAAGADAALALHEENVALGAVAATLTEKHRHDRRVAALSKESALLQNPATLAAAARADYDRDAASNLMTRTASGAEPMLVPPPVDLDAVQPPPRRASFAPAGGKGKAAAQAHAMAQTGAGSRAPSPSPAPSRSQAASPASAPQHAASASPPSRGAGARPASAPPSAASQPAPHAPVHAHASAAEMRARRVASEGPVATPALLGSGSGSGGDAARPSKADVARRYAGLPGLKKRVAATTGTSAFSFMSHPAAHALSIRESNVWRMVEEKRAAEEAALRVKFKAQPIARATADIGLFAKIMAKNEERRRVEHDRKAAYAAAHFKPFTVVTAHCDEAAARVAAKRAEAELALQRELAASAVFLANTVPASTSNPDSMFFKILQREAEKPERVAAAARALAASASLPPRMASGVVDDARKAAAKLAAQAAAEKAEAARAAFHANAIPPLKQMQESFKASCERARVAVTSAWRAVETAPFSFDEPARVAAERARADALRREHELKTSRSMDLRKTSRAFAEGADLVDGAHADARGYAGGLKGTLGVNPLLEASALLGASQARAAAARPASAPASVTARLSKSSAPPAAMTKSVRLKALAVQARLRAAQEKALLDELADEAFDAHTKHANARFTPLFVDLERTRVPTPLAWQMDGVTAASSDRARAFRARSAALAKDIKARLAAVADRPLMMLSAAEEAAANAARVGALVKVAKVTARLSASVQFAASRGGEGDGEGDGAGENEAPLPADADDEVVAAVGA